MQLHTYIQTTLTSWTKGIQHASGLKLLHSELIKNHNIIKLHM